MPLTWALVAVLAADGGWALTQARVAQLEAEYVEAMEAPSDAALDTPRVLAEEVVVRSRALGAPGEDVWRAAVVVRDGVLRRVPPLELLETFEWLAARFERSGRVPLAPDEAPDFALGERVFRRNCAACHGVDGRARTPLAESLSPPPADLGHPDVVNGLSPLQVFRVVSHGEVGSAMPAFAATLSERERWAVSFHVLALRHPRCDGPTPKRSWVSLARQTDNALVAAHGDRALACLRRPRRGGRPPSKWRLTRPTDGPDPLLNAPE